jgi:cobalamin synthase
MSGDLPVWAQIMTGLAILALLFFFGPSAYRAAKDSPKGSAGDWLGLLIPIGGVVLFIILLIALARG